MAIPLDVDLTKEDVARLTSADALAALLQRLGYPTNKRAAIPLEALGLAGADKDIQKVEMLAEDPEGFLRVVFAQVRSLTAKARNELVKTFGKHSKEYLLVITRDFETLEFVLVEKVQQQRKGPGQEVVTKAQGRVFAVPRRWPNAWLRIIRRLTFTMADGLQQYDKLRSVFDAAHFSGQYFQNRALFADHYLENRLPNDPAWTDSPNAAFTSVSELMAKARERFAAYDEATIRTELFEPLWKVLGFKAVAVKQSKDPAPDPDYRLLGKDGEPRTVALVYAWSRWLDGPDAHDPDTPNENPGAAVVTLLDRGDAEWVIVTNGKFWRLYSRHAHSRSTNFYEVDLEDALLASGQTDPNEAFRYWWLFFRQEAFAPASKTDKTCWLDRVAQGSRDYAKQVEAELKKRVFHTVVPQLAQGFLEDRRVRLGVRQAPTEAELEETREATLTLLYRILFLLYAESRDLLPVHESPYYQISLKRIKDQIADAVSVAESAADQKLAAAYGCKETGLYDRLSALFSVIDGGDAAANVPTYNGGLFRVNDAAEGDAPGDREAAIARFLNERKVPDLYLATAIDRLARVPDEKLGETLVFVDYKSLGVRQLGSIYEGLLEYRLNIAAADLAAVSEKGIQRYIPLSQARPKKRTAGVIVKAGEVYLDRDKSERKATGSYYTPDHIVEYIVEHTVGPVLQGKLEALRLEFRKAEKTYQQALRNGRDNLQLVMLWLDPRRQHPAGPGAAPQLPARPTEADVRDWAADKAYGIHKDLVDKLFDLKVLDPAMGSGHFLVEAVDFITDRLLDFLNSFPNNPVSAAMERTRQSILDSLAEQGIETDALLAKQLTDVHLIKRHVLKRCIYGVDLNPLATELAKVSLWLDAFTIGAPLSFLDHHVRVGNSLLGAAVQQVQDALEETQLILFGSRFAGLKLAAIGMAAIGAIPDATADQVRTSQREYRRASHVLAPFKRILDAYLMQWFLPDDVLAAMPKRKRSAEHPVLEFLKAKEAEPFFAAGGDDQVRAAVDALKGADCQLAEAILRVSNERRFFHWELEFPEAFYGPRPGTARVIERMENPGFDAVVGNPPYVRGDLLDNATKSCLRISYSTVFDGLADIFAYFLARSASLIRTDGFASMIVQDSLLQVPALAGIRRELCLRATVRAIVDFQSNRPFEDADMRPTIVTLAGCRYLSDADYVQLSVPLPANRLLDGAQTTRIKGNELVCRASTGWSLRHFGGARLLDLIRSAARPLHSSVGEPYRGITTGANDVFVIDGDTAREIQRRDRRAAEIIRPFADGPNVRPFRVVPGDEYLIFTRRGVRVHDYPGVMEYLLAHKTRLTPRSVDHPDGGRKPGSYEWYEIQDSTAYHEIFEEPKVLFPDTVKGPRFALFEGPLYCGNTVYVLATGDPAIMGILNSSVIWFVIASTFQTRDERAGKLRYRLLVQDVRNLPIPETKRAEWRTVRQLATRLKEQIGGGDAAATYAELDKAVGALYGLSDEHLRAVKESFTPDLSFLSASSLDSAGA